MSRQVYFLYFQMTDNRCKRYGQILTDVCKKYVRERMQYLVRSVYTTVGSCYPDFRITRPRILCFINRTNPIWNLGGLIIRKTKPNSVFFRILRPKIGVSLSRKIQFSPDKFRIKRPPSWVSSSGQIFRLTGSRYLDPVNETSLYKGSFLSMFHI